MAQRESTNGEWTPTEVAAMIGWRYGKGHTTVFDGGFIADEFGLGWGSITALFDAIEVKVGKPYTPSLYALSGKPLKIRRADADTLDTRAGAFLLGWLLAQRLWFTLTDAVEWTGWQRGATRQILEIRMRYLPMWILSRESGARETLCVSIDE